MATIEVNHKTLRDAAVAITSYCDAQDKQMRLADTEIKLMLASDWLGTDAQEFGSKWEGVDERGSVAAGLRDSLKAFGESLVACANEYQSVQEHIYNEANRILKCFYW